MLTSALSDYLSVKDIAKAAASSGNLRAFFRQSPIEEKVTRAEVLFANFIAEPVIQCGR